MDDSMKTNVLNSMIENFKAYADSHSGDVSFVEHGTGRKVTFGEYLSLAADIETELASRGIKKGDVVILRLGRTVEHMAARLAMMSMGAVIVSVEPNVPDGRIKMMESDVGAKLVIDDGFFPVKSSGKVIRNESMDDDSPCFVIYTSGSTGAPKGIIHPRGTVTYLVDYLKGLKLDDYSNLNVGMIVSTSFIVSWTEFVFNLAFHSTNHMYTDEMRADVIGMRERVNRDRIDIMVCNPSYYRALGSSAKIRYVVLAGEKPVDFERTDSRVYDCYGSSEAIFASRILNGKDGPGHLTPTVPGGEMFAVDENGQRSETGELVYRGRGIMLGYVGGSTDGHPLKEYHTGDIAVKADDGYEIIGRKGSMVKINGQRVEPAETECSMERIPGINNAVVKAFTDNGTYLCAYYVSDDVNEDTVRTELRKTLNCYQIPKYIRRYDALPLNENGKVDRASLGSLRRTTGTTEAPRTESEILVCKAFETALNVERVGMDDDFIELGGDSLGTSRLISAFDGLKTQSPLLSGMRIRPHDVMHLRTPRRMVENLCENIAYGEEYDFTTGAPAPDSVKDGYILAKIFGESTFTLPIFVSLDSWKDHDDVEAQIMGLVELFPVLSMRLEHRGDRLWMMFDRRPTIVKSEEDLKPTDMVGRCNLDPDKDVLTTFYTFRHEGKMAMVAVVSHLVFDGRSGGPLIRAILKGRKGPDRGILIQGAYDEANKGTEKYRMARDLYLASVRPVFPEEIRALPKYDVESTGKIYAPMDTPIDAVRRFAKECGVSITTVLATAFGIAKAKAAECDESTFSLVTGGRTAPGTEDSVGMFTMVVPFHVYRNGMGVKEYLSSVSDRTNELIANSEFPVCDMAPEYYPDVNFLFQYSDFMSDLFAPIPGARGELLKGDTWHHGSTMSIQPRGDILLIWMKYSVRYREEEIADLLCDFDETLERMLTAERMDELW